MVLNLTSEEVSQIQTVVVEANVEEKELLNETLRTANTRQEILKLSFNVATYCSLYNCKAVILKGPNPNSSELSAQLRSLGILALFTTDKVKV
ncbi:MAG: hypothetical protein M0R77_00725 [Gammaproteobacteria bacterium]|nr:hypothetical protein [Acholeplasmataceae bacterium]MCK9529078.1 hypothetical protein [Gammaproteobacteria bacterium]